MDEPWIQYAKKKKLSTKDRILCGSSYMKYPEWAPP